MFTSSIKSENSYFPVVIVQSQQRNVQKSVMHVQSCCFAYSTYCFFDVLVVVIVVESYSNLTVPNIMIMILLGQVLAYHLPKKVLLSCHLECRFVSSNKQIF